MAPIKSVLIVDDDDDIREIEAEILMRAGYSVMQAENGRIALELLGTIEEPCLVLLNIVMPEMSGTELLAVLRERGRLETLPVIIVSATYVDASASNGEVRSVRKPVAMQVLLSLVAEYCQAC